MTVYKPSDLIIPDIKFDNLHKEDDIKKTKDEDSIEFLAAIVECSTDSIFSRSLDGIITSWNRGCEKMFGYSAKQAIGKHIYMIIPPEHINAEEKTIAKVMNNEFIGHYETVRNGKNGGQFYVSLSASPIKNKRGVVTGISQIARDITSGKKSETALRQANDELKLQNDEKEKRAAELIIANKDLEISEEQIKEVNKELESFSYSISHDLRAPLRAINGYAKMLKANFETQLDPEANRLVNNIVNNASKMSQLIDELLNFSRLGRRELVMMNIPMNTIVTDICEELKNEQGHRHIEFHIGELLPAQADNMTIKQVWLNLISNAIKYSRLQDTAIIEIASELTGDEITYFIKDNGAGFDMRYADKLFGVFQRLHSEEEFEGTGVGLALVHRIITKHGGRVWGEGKVNKGAKFCFTLLKL